MSENRKLAYNVHVEGEDGELHVFGAESDVPAWARKKITNPSAWVDGEDSPEPDAEPDPETKSDPEPTKSKGGKGKGKDSGKAEDKAPAKETYTRTEWTVAKLKAEVETRNEGRADDDVIEVEAPGNKPEFQAALVADDAVQADNDA